ncbi:MAG: helix-turn-helix transcriptional regulator [Tatlockia sp.]|nr:helix-turn-helix transcriptional regulator [Tatlockia sp.]
MIKNIGKASESFLNKTFSQLDLHEDYVFWVREREMTKQVYQGKNFAKIWQRDPNIVNKYPLIWLDFLEDTRKEFYMQQLQQRHNENYNNPELNLIYYQIKKPDNSVEYIIDNCFKCISADNLIYIVGIAKRISHNNWTAIDQDNTLIYQEFDKSIQDDFFKLLKSHFCIIPFDQIKATKTLASFQEKILAEGILFSNRETETLYYLCLGNTAKETAKIMTISSRTVETYIEQIRIKINGKNRLDIVGKFSRYLETS